MLKRYNTSRAPSAAPARSVSAGVAHGLAQIATLGAAGSFFRFPTPRSDGNALKSDWERLGGDMKRAVEAERRRGKTDPA